MNKSVVTREMLDMALDIVGLMDCVNTLSEDSRYNIQKFIMAVQGGRVSHAKLESLREDLLRENAELYAKESPLGGLLKDLMGILDGLNELKQGEEETEDEEETSNKCDTCPVREACQDLEDEVTEDEIPDDLPEGAERLSDDEIPDFIKAMAKMTGAEVRAYKVRK